MVFEHGNAYVRVDHGIFELFRRNIVIGSYRAPLNWVKVRTDARRGGVTRVHVAPVARRDAARDIF
ncbi:hypothetical protein [Streptomyces acidicola]|uniref:hypothetical protein n=1 Tax=Streptomyces acidicola TaxID=2596892 RepID=UPI00380F8DBD